MSQFEGFNRRYQAELAEEIQVHSEAILSGNISDWAEYKRLVGRLSAFKQMLERHKELISLMEQANDR